MTEEEFGNLLDYLIKRLNSLGHNEIVSDINSIISAGRMELSKSDEILVTNKIKTNSVGKSGVRQLTKKEAFSEVVNFLKSVLLEVPKYKAKINSEFGENVKWEFDQAKDFEGIITNEKFSVTNIEYSDNDIESMNEIFNDLEKSL